MTWTFVDAFVTWTLFYAGTATLENDCDDVSSRGNDSLDRVEATCRGVGVQS